MLQLRTGVRTLRVGYRSALTMALTLLILTACVVRAPEASRAATPGARLPVAPGVLHTKFLIGVWIQTASTISGWKSLGVNTMVYMPWGPPGAAGRAEAARWDAAVSASKLWEVRRPIGDVPAEDPGRTNPNIIAWMLPDEPENPYAGGDPYTPAQIKAMYQRDKAATPSRPVWLNLIGGPLAGRYGIKRDAQYARWSDWRSADDYPITQRRPDPIHIISREMRGLLQTGSPSGGLLTFIETGQVAPGRPVVTPAQMRAQIWEAVVAGARGIVFYTWDTGTTGRGKRVVITDNTSPAIRAEMKRDATFLAHLPVGALQGVVNPAGVAAAAPAPFDVGWRSSGAGTFFVVVNTSAQKRATTIRLGGLPYRHWLSVFGEHRFVWFDGHSIHDTFAPYGVHIYMG